MNRGHFCPPYRGHICPPVDICVHPSGAIPSSSRVDNRGHLSTPTQEKRNTTENLVWR